MLSALYSPSFGDAMKAEEMLLEVLYAWYANVRPS